MFDVNDQEKVYIDAVYSYRDTIIQRIQDELGKEQMKIFVYDCYVFIRQILIDSGQSKEENLDKEITFLIKAILAECFLALNIRKTVTLSEDRHFVYLS